MISLPEEELEDIKSLTSNPGNLIDTIYLLKKENFNLQKEIATITIECNKMLRGTNGGSK